MTVLLEVRWEGGGSAGLGSASPCRPCCRLGRLTLPPTSYAANWCDVIPAMKSAGVAGPFFVSIGDEEKLNKFLDLNPKVSQCLETSIRASPFPPPLRCRLNSSLPTQPPRRP